MGKTAHHQKDKFDKREWPEGYRLWWRGRGRQPVRQHRIYDLRYSSAELRDAAEQGRRPSPDKVRRTASWYSYSQAWAPSSARTYAATRNERDNRRYVKAQLNAGLRTKGELQKRLYEKAEKKARRKLYDIC